MKNLAREAQAVEHTRKMQDKYAQEISKAVEDTLYFTNCYLDDLRHLEKAKRPEDTVIEVINNYIVEELLCNNMANQKSAVLNFASYKYAGGHFIYGAMAQEEALCHGSFLYNVLSSDSIENQFYIPNRKHDLNREMYYDKVLFSPDIVFEDDMQSKKVNVITCAAPNAYIAKTEYNVSKKEIESVMESRIRSILLAAYDCKIENLFLGAFGCGVFGNEPETVAGIFKELFETEFKNTFKYVAFVIPKAADGNYTTFHNYF